MTEALELPPIPATLGWKNQPLNSAVGDQGQLTITTGPVTDWFIDPAGSAPNNNAPIALFAPPAETFWLKAKVTVDFTATFDAGVLFVYENDTVWAKLCFEYSPANQPMVVSVVTRGVSDDCNGVPISGNSVYLRLYRQGEIFAFHYSSDGKFWHFVRYFTLGSLTRLQIGFEAQSPTGKTCTASFTEIEFKAAKLSDLRNGE